MTTKTVFCVQPYGGSDRKFIKGALKEFGTREAALDAGSALARRAPGVVVFSVTGDPVAECWDDPEILAKHGRLPRLA